MKETFITGEDARDADIQAKAGGKMTVR